MAYTLEQIKSDLLCLDERQFYLKYIVRSENWYFEKVLNCPPEELSRMSDDFRLVVSEALGISFNSVLIVGSSKTGYSLSPSDKYLQPFSTTGVDRKMSDIDVAIISEGLFHKFWKMFRDVYSQEISGLYRGLYTEIYRGFINEKYLMDIDGCRREWLEISSDSKRKLADKFFMKHEVTYRIYRSWEDFEEYNLKGVQKLRLMVAED